MRKSSMVRILRPNFTSKDQRGNSIIPQLSDYVEVPRLSLYGTYEIESIVRFTKRGVKF